jgi:hypothetical protein
VAPSIAMPVLASGDSTPDTVSARTLRASHEKGRVATDLLVAADLEATIKIHRQLEFRGARVSRVRRSSSLLRSPRVRTVNAGR